MASAKRPAASLAQQPTRQSAKASDPNALGWLIARSTGQSVAEHLIATDKTPLLGKEWIIETIAGGGVVDNSQATLQFMSDGRLAGNATCNRMFGSYVSPAPNLSIKPGGTTRMACPDALTNQERKLLKLLPGVESYVVGESCALVLKIAAGVLAAKVRSRRLIDGLDCA